MLSDAEVLTVFRAAEEAGFETILIPVSGACVVTAGDPANPSGVGFGRMTTTPDGRRVAHCESFIVREQFRGPRSMAILGEMHGKWMDLARTMGAEQLTTNIERTRPEMVTLMRRYRYAPYAIDENYVWYRRAA